MAKGKYKKRRNNYLKRQENIKKKNENIELNKNIEQKNSSIRKKKKTNKKYLSYILISSIIFLIIFTIGFYLKNNLEIEKTEDGIDVYFKNYNIEKAIFDVELLPNGDALITETWNVYYKGNFNGFYKDIPSITRNDSFEIIKSSINGIECSIKNENTDNLDYVFTPNIVMTSSEDFTNSVLSLKWHLKTNSPTVYSVKYLLKDVVIEKDNKAFFTYTFIGKRFLKPIDKIYINLITNEPININIDDKSNKNYEVKDIENGISLYLTDVYSGLNFQFYLDRNYFEELNNFDELIPINNIDDNKLKNIILTFVGILMIFALLFKPNKNDTSSSKYDSPSSSYDNTDYGSGGCGGCGGGGAF